MSQLFGPGRLAHVIPYLAIATLGLLVIMVLVIVLDQTTYKYVSLPLAPVNLNYKFSFGVTKRVFSAYDTGTCAIVAHENGLWLYKQGVLYDSGTREGIFTGGVGNKAWLFSLVDMRIYVFIERNNSYHEYASVAANNKQDGDFVEQATSSDPPFLHIRDAETPTAHSNMGLTGTENGYVLYTERPGPTDDDPIETYFWVYRQGKRLGGHQVILDRSILMFRATVLDNDRVLVMYQEGPKMILLTYFIASDTWQTVQTLNGTHGRVGPNCDTLALAQSNLTQTLLELDRSSGTYKTSAAVDISIDECAGISNRTLFSEDAIYQS